MRVIITKPDGTKIYIDGEQVCWESSPEKCHRLSPRIAEFMVHRAWHKGWKVETIHEAH